MELYKSDAFLDELLLEDCPYMDLTVELLGMGIARANSSAPRAKTASSPGWRRRRPCGKNAAPGWTVTPAAAID